MQEPLAQIDLYTNVENDELNRLLTQALASIDLDSVVQYTLQEAGVNQPVMLTLLITDDETLRDMNRQYRQQNIPTDVLSFPLLNKPLVDAPAEQLWSREETAEQDEKVFVTPPELTTNLGDIAISWPTVIRQAGEVGHSPTYELVYLIAHGVLHLVGYDDHTEAGYQTMVRLQHNVLAAVGQKA
ncbi:MAG: rRNA maturation RNase YbeY [Chloroflexota bacterium]|nr:rRNA maturation RNase YbeY [Chloroflexota bacterium]